MRRYEPSRYGKRGNYHDEPQCPPVALDRGLDRVPHTVTTSRPGLPAGTLHSPATGTATPERLGQAEPYFTVRRNSGQAMQEIAQN